MSEYDGPAFNKRQHRSNSNRRFNRLTDREGSKRLFNPDHKDPTVNHEEPTYYELPTKVRSMDLHEDLSPPVNRQHLNAKIEHAQVNQEINGKENYSVPFLKNREMDRQDKSFLSAQEVVNETTESNKIYSPSERFKSERYQPALSEQSAAQTINDQSSIETFEQSDGKSINPSRIREVAVRLAKEKTSYLLFEYSKEN